MSDNQEPEFKIPHIKMGDRIKYHGKYAEDYSCFDSLLVTGVYFYRGNIVVNCYCLDGDEVEFFYEDESDFEVLENGKEIS